MNYLRLVDEACHVCVLDADGLDLLESFDGQGASDKARALAERLSRETGLPLKVRYERD